MMALMKGCTRAGDKALRLSTSSSTYNARARKHILFLYVNNIMIGNQWGGVYLGEQVETAQVTDDTVDFW